MTNRQVNAPLRRSNDLPYGFSSPPILSRTHPDRPATLRRVPGEPMKQEVEPFHGALNPW